MSAITDIRRRDHLVELEVELKAANALAEGYAEALFSLRKVLTGRAFADRETVSVDQVLGFMRTAHEHAAAREYVAKQDASS